MKSNIFVFLNILHAPGITLYKVVNRNQKRIREGKGDSKFQIPVQVKKYIHIDKSDLVKYNSFIITCRNPLDRLKS